MKNGDKINLWAIAVGWFVANVVGGIIFVPIAIIAGLSFAASVTDTRKRYRRFVDAELPPYLPNDYFYVIDFGKLARYYKKSEGS